MLHGRDAGVGWVRTLSVEMVEWCDGNETAPDALI
jgi:hypothetical protein